MSAQNTGRLILPVSAEEMSRRSVLRLSAGYLLFTMTAQGQTIDRTKPPQTPELPGFKLPSVTETSLPNGLQLVMVEDRRLPLITARLGFQAGSKFDPSGVYGLSESTAALLTGGTKNRDARKIAEEAAEMGGSIRAFSDPDSLFIATNALASNLPKMLELLADVALNANFPEDEVQLRKQNRRQELLAQRSQADFLAEEKLIEMLFRPHPYAWQEPTLESLEKLDRAGLAGFRDRYLLPNNAVLILIGALPPVKQVTEAIEKQFGSWKKKELPAPLSARIQPAKSSITLLDRPGSVQADIRIGQVAVHRANPDYFPLLLGNTILGGGASSRLFMNIREKQGFAYDAHSALQPLRDSGWVALVTQIRNEVLEPALTAVLDEMRRINSEKTPVEELSAVQNYLSGVFVIRLETQDGLANQIAGTKLSGLPLSYLETYTARVRSVKPEQIQAAASRYLDPGNSAIVVVGDASKLAPQLEKFGKVTVEKAQ